ncbi:membrane protein [Comamonas testosteroni]|uniref:Membrane protein n=1 Tax=Comamonas testosteroni TaxID=285 RepID=A0A5A7MMR1_COMTE|nr:tripartite tricarboxylate transporter TctB family protein [Comamonas testosteroni]GEQ78121.1 membrane protein [Comamonas testosteroni]
MSVHRQRLYSGFLFIAIALAFGIGGIKQYPIGSAASMGPGYFPVLLSSVLMLLGIAALAQAARMRARNSEATSDTGRHSWRPVVFIVLANMTFGILLEGAPSIGLPAQGLIVSIYGVTFIASLAGREHRTGQALVLATVLAACSYLIFIKLLGLTVLAWPSYLTQ